MTSFYYDNMINFFSIKNEGGRLVADWPLMKTDGPVGMYDVADTGAYVVEAFSKPDEWLGEISQSFSSSTISLIAS